MEENSMSSSRREFVAGLGAAGALAAVPRPVRASLAGPLYPPMNLAAFDVPVHKGDPFVRAGCSAITWSDNAAQAIDDISADGFAGIQLRSTSIPIRTSSATCSPSTSSPSLLCPAARPPSIQPCASRSLKPT
jgi:hypothetical protein